LDFAIFVFKAISTAQLRTVWKCCRRWHLDSERTDDTRYVCESIFAFVGRSGQVCCNTKTEIS